MQNLLNSQHVFLKHAKVYVFTYVGLGAVMIALMTWQK